MLSGILFDHLKMLRCGLISQILQAKKVNCRLFVNIVAKSCGFQVLLEMITFKTWEDVHVHVQFFPLEKRQPHLQTVVNAHNQLEPAVKSSWGNLSPHLKLHRFLNDSNCDCTFEDFLKGTMCNFSLREVTNSKQRRSLTICEYFE